MAELYELTIHEAAEKMRAGEISSEDLTAAVLQRIEAVESKVGAYVARDAEKTLASAREADVRRKEQGDDAATLLGVPVALKDNLCTSDYPTTCSSRILENFTAPYDAHVVERLRAQGAVILGKTNLDEFAMGSSTETSAPGPTRNPWNTDYIPGGSSGGSAAAVAAGMALGSLGSDTGGSIRQPASHCGVVGLKPTYGRVSRYGLVAFGSSLDQIGPLTRDVRDAAILLQAIAGNDQRDATSAPQSQTPFTIDQMQSPEKLRIGIVKECGSDGLDAAVADTMAAARKTLEGMGAEIVEVSLPHMDYAIATYYLVATAEASSNLARYDGAHYGHRAADSKNIIDMFSRSRAEGFGDEVKRRIMLGTYVLSAGFYDAYYLKALKVRTLIKQDFEKAFDQTDVLLMPTAPTPAFKLGEKLDDPLQMYLSDIFTIATNLAGIPALSIPAGYSQDGLPVGVQFQAPAFEEAKLLSVASAFEQAHDLEARQPEL